MRELRYFCAAQSLLIVFYTLLLVLAVLTGLSFQSLGCGLLALLMLWAAWVDFSPLKRPARIVTRSKTGVKKKKKRGVSGGEVVYRITGKGRRITRYVDLDAGVYELRYWLPADMPAAVWLIDLHSQACDEIVPPAVGQGSVLFEIDASRYVFQVRPHKWGSFRWRLEFERIE